MSTLSQFLGGGVTTAIINAFSAGNEIASGNGSGLGSSVGNAAREVLSGAVTANALVTLLSVTGSGRVPFLTAYTKNATTRTIRLVVEVDGVSVFDATSSASPGFASSGMAAAGSRSEGNLWGEGAPIVFAASLVVRVASSLTETDGVAIGYILHRS